MSIQNSTPVKPFPVMVYASVVVALIISGILVSGYLMVSHYKVYTDITYSSFCAISKAINCDTVSQSPYSIFWNVPVPAWGIIGYLFLLITLVMSWGIRLKSMRLFPSLLLICLMFSSISIFLAILSAVKIHSYCIMCIVTYGINFLLLYMIWLMKRRFEKAGWTDAVKKDCRFWTSASNRSLLIKTYLPFVVVILMTMALMPDYWHLGPSDFSNQNLTTGITADGSPWIGAKTPEITIVEYTDYMCFQCRKMHFFLRSLINENPDSIRLVHRHFPMDKKTNPALGEDLHPGSGILSAIAVHAATENRFWQVNDYLYHYNMDHRAIYLQQIARETGLDLQQLKTGIHRPAVRLKLQRDIVSGLKLNIVGTPSYVINDVVYAGQIPADILESLK